LTAFARLFASLYSKSTFDSLHTISSWATLFQNTSLRHQPRFASGVATGLAPAERNRCRGCGAPWRTASAQRPRCCSTPRPPVGPAGLSRPHCPLTHPSPPPRTPPAGNADRWSTPRGFSAVS
jgi:hypothetical protein